MQIGDVIKFTESETAVIQTHLNECHSAAAALAMFANKLRIAQEALWDAIDTVRPDTCGYHRGLEDEGAAMRILSKKHSDWRECLAEMKEKLG